jgi:PIN domain nuclease of toxin-antitoxin system
VGADEFLTNRFGVTINQHPFTDICSKALALTWTRDPFDRLIVAHAISTGVKLAQVRHGKPEKAIV